MSNFFPIGLIFFLIYYFLKDHDKTPEINQSLLEEPFKGGVPEKNIVYLSNSRVLQEPHIFHYFYMLNLQEAPYISAETIENAASKRYGLINKIDYDVNQPVASRDVNAAKMYLIDRWLYMGHLN